MKFPVPEVSRACAYVYNDLRLTPGPEFNELNRAEMEAKTIDELPQWIKDALPPNYKDGMDPLDPTL